jgi:hypothetical protein
MKLSREDPRGLLVATEAERDTPAAAGSGRMGPWTVLLMLGMVVVPAAITLSTIQSPVTLQQTSPDPSPRGYTWSLLLFLVPIVSIALWLGLSRARRFPRRTFWWTIGIMVCLGFGLDFFFAHRFFLFPNPGATLGLRLPALGGPVPVEEYAFYLTGFVAILLLYVWLDEYWLAAYNVPDYSEHARHIPRLLQFHPTSLVIGSVLIVAAVIYKKAFSANPEGFPEYFTFLVATAVVPAAGLFPTVRSVINWQALSVTVFFILLVSLIWEATLAIPYGWWGYQPRQMVGLSIGAWSGLPIEAVGVWFAAAYTTTIVFETVKLWKASGKTAKDAFVGY